MENALVLVTGGSGFVATHCLVQLLQQGYRVRTTVRSLSRQDAVTKLLQDAGVAHLERLSFVEADLSADAGWQAAAEGCTYVLHVASPIFLRIPRDEAEMIRPSVEGTIRVLKAARDAGVKRVVMTSNFGAVGYSHQDKTRPITEESWTNPDQKGLSAYNKSKTLAERAAWNFMAEEGRRLELAVVNPVGIFGPSLDATLSSGFGLFLQVLNGTLKAIPDMALGIVDVRDVADLHLRAMTHPEAAGQRFLALAGGTMTLLEMGRLVRLKRPEAAKKASLKSLPTPLLRLVALFNPQARAILPMVGVYRNASNEKARKLGWSPRTNEEAVLATVESLVRFGHLPEAPSDLSAPS